MDNPEVELAADIGRFSANPLAFVRYAYPWQEPGELAEYEGPRNWQREVLETIGAHLSGPNRFDPLLYAISSGHGVGKSALIAMIVNWAMSTCDDCRVVITANTEPQLRTKTWPEVSKWTRLSVNSHWWNITATTLSVREKAHERLWRSDAIAWSENNTEAFAGLHNKGRRIVLVFDEGSAIADKIWEVSEGALTDEQTEIIWLVFGNPTRNTGRFRECFGRYKHRWITKQIDSRTIDGTNKEQISKWIADYGEDSDFCRVRVRGEFPRAGASQFIAGDIVANARSRNIAAEGHKVLSVDVARFGEDQCFDDQTEILTDHGWRFFEDLDGTERVLSLDGDVAVWGDITHIHQALWDAPLNVIEKKCINFAITDNHRMLVRSTPKSKDYVFRAYRDLPQDFVVRAGNQWSGTSEAERTFTTKKQMPHGGEHILTYTFKMEDWATFLGWFVSEGNVYRERRSGGRLRVIVTQYPSAKRDALEALLTRMGLKWRECSNGNQIEFSNLAIGRWLIEHCGVGAAKKRVPEEIKEGSTGIIKCFLDGFMAGDGSMRADGNGRTYSTSSAQLADDLQEMLAKIGRAGLLREKESIGSVFEIDGRRIVRKTATYVVYERSFESGKWVNKRDVQRVPYKGFVWCVATPLESIYVRRHGVSMWSGNTVIGIRQGYKLRVIAKLRGLDTMQVAHRVMEVIRNERPRTTIIDGDGIGAGVVDCIRHEMRDWYQAHPRERLHEFHGGEGPANSSMYFNRRAEVWGMMREWLKEGDIPDDPELAADLTGPEYFFSSKNQIQLEKKEDMKRRGLSSPDVADMLSMSFASSPAETYYDEMSEEAAASMAEANKRWIENRSMESNTNGWNWQD